MLFALHQSSLKTNERTNNINVEIDSHNLFSLVSLNNENSSLFINVISNNIIMAQLILIL